MINITVTELNKDNVFEFKIQGHADGRENCARITGSFEMLSALLYNDIVIKKQFSGYSLLIVKITEINKNPLLLATKFLKDLADNSNTITFTFKEL